MNETMKDKTREFQLIIYGATGFTGQIAAKYINDNYTSLKWGIAGRNKDKLIKVSELCKNNKPNIIIGESNNREQLNDIASKTKVLLSFAGPFNKYSNLMVECCLNEGTHYLDITGENIWVRDLIDRHHDKAEKKGVKIIPSCGYDSIPSDIGSFFSQRELNKKIVSIDCYQSGGGGISGGTIESAFSMMEYKTKNKLGHTFLLNPRDSYTDIQRKNSKDKFSIKKIDYFNSWSAPFVMAPANTRVVRRSAALLDMRQSGYGESFVYNEFMETKKYSAALIVSASLVVLGMVLSLPFRRLFRPFFTKPGNGPSQKTQDNGWFKSKFIIKTEDNKTYLSKMYGNGDPGYKSTARFACESAMTIISDSEKLDYMGGGVLTTAAGLGEALINRLINKGVTFEKPVEIK